MKIIGKNIALRTVETTDAEFIYSMRQNENKSKYLSKVTGTIKDQENWIKNYKQKELQKEEFYFVIESKDEEKLGLVRVYDLTQESFCWGSWMIKENAPISTAIESALQIYEFGFYELGYKKCHFDVRKGNEKVLKFHRNFGAKVIAEDKVDYFFNFNIQDYVNIKQKYKRYL